MKRMGRELVSEYSIIGNRRLSLFLSVAKPDRRKIEGTSASYGCFLWNYGVNGCFPLSHGPKTETGKQPLNQDVDRRDHQKEQPEEASILIEELSMED